MGGVKNVLQESGEAERQCTFELACNEPATWMIEGCRELVGSRRAVAQPSKEDTCSLHGRECRGASGSRRGAGGLLRNAEAGAGGGKSPAVVAALEGARGGDALAGEGERSGVE